MRAKYVSRIESQIDYDYRCSCESDASAYVGVYTDADGYTHVGDAMECRTDVSNSESLYRPSFDSAKAEKAAKADYKQIKKVQKAKTVAQPLAFRITRQDLDLLERPVISEAHVIRRIDITNAKLAQALSTAVSRIQKKKRDAQWAQYYADRHRRSDTDFDARAAYTEALMAEIRAEMATTQ